MHVLNLREYILLFRIKPYFSVFKYFHELKYYVHFKYCDKIPPEYLIIIFFYHHGVIARATKLNW